MKRRGANFVEYDECQKFVCDLGVLSSKQWQKWCKNNYRPNNIPFQPNKIYKEWINWGDFLKTGIIACKDWKFLSFEESRAIVIAQKFRSKTEFSQWKNRPPNIPASPSSTHKNKGWINWSHWLGYRHRTSYGESCIDRFLVNNAIEYKQQVTLDGCRNQNKLPFDFGIYDGGRLVALIEFHGQQHYKYVKKWEKFDKTTECDIIKVDYCKLSGIPLLVIPHWDFDNLNEVIAGFLKNILDKEDFIMDGRIKTDVFSAWMEFEDARKYVTSLGFKSVAQFRAWADSDQKHPIIPKYPDVVYRKSGWKGYSDFLGTGNIAPYNRKFVSFEDCRELAKNLSLKSENEWFDWVRKNLDRKDIPIRPDSTYEQLGWNGWDNFLGKEFLSFEDCKAYVVLLGLKKKNDWMDWVKTKVKPDNIPADPYGVYQNSGWVSWTDFLGVSGGLTSRNSEFLSYDEAKLVVKELGIKSSAEYIKISRQIKSELKLPGIPQDYYKTRGVWINWYDYLGK